MLLVACQIQWPLQLKRLADSMCRWTENTRQTPSTRSATKVPRGSDRNGMLMAWCSGFAMEMRKVPIHVYFDEGSDNLGVQHPVPNTQLS